MLKQLCGALILGFALCPPSGAHAFDALKQDKTPSQIEPLILDINYDWDKKPDNFIMQATPQNSLGVGQAVAVNTSDINEAKPQKQKKEKDSSDFGKDLLEKIPYSHSLKQTWDVVDGDVDLMVTGLRADRRNKGVSYTMTSLPLWGDMVGTEMEFSAGEQNEISFESSYLPMVGDIEGFQIKAKAKSTDDSSVYVRYKFKLP